MIIQSQLNNAFKFLSFTNARKLSTGNRNAKLKDRLIVSVVFIQLCVWFNPALAVITPGQGLEPLDFNATFISGIAKSRAGSGNLSELIGQVGGLILQDQFSNKAICTRATVQSVSYRQVSVNLECAAEDGTQLTVAAYSETDKAVDSIKPAVIVVRDGQADAILAMSASGLTLAAQRLERGISSQDISQFLVINKGDKKIFSLSEASTSLFSMVHEFSPGARVRPEPERGVNFTQFSIKQTFNAVTKISRPAPKAKPAATLSDKVSQPAASLNRDFLSKVMPKVAADSKLETWPDKATTRTRTGGVTTPVTVAKYISNPNREKQNVTASRLWQLPLYDGKYPISSCQSRNRACGKKAADAFCRREGYSEASSFLESNNIATTSKPAVALSDGSFCTTASCKVLSNVACVLQPNIGIDGRYVSNDARYDDQTNIYTNPRTSGYRVDNCLNWGKDCGKPAADTFCKLEGFAGSKTHTLGPGVGAFPAITTLVLNSGQTCTNPGCVGFKTIQCTNEAAPIDIVTMSKLLSPQIWSLASLSLTPKGESGPSLNNIESLDISTGNIHGVKTEAALPFHDEIWRDTNDASIYYYAPKKFQLSYDKPNAGKLGINAIYGNDSAAEKPIILTLHFDTRIDQGDVYDLSRLMQNIFTARGESKDFTLKRFPIGEYPNIIFNLIPGSGDPLVIEVDDDKFSTLSLQWTLTEELWQQWQVSLRDQSVSSGEILLTPPDTETQPTHEIKIAAAAVATNSIVYGVDAPDDLSSWTNNTPFPVILERINGLGQINARPSSVSWSLANTKLMPGEQVFFETDETNFPAILKARMVKYWIDYRLDTTCQTCVDNALPTQSVSSSLGRNITFVLPSSYDASAYEEVQVIVRSRYLTPQASHDVTSPMMVLATPGQEEEIASPLFLPDGRQLSEGGLAQAKITVVTAGGERTVSGAWFDLDKERNYISPSVIQNVLDTYQ